MKYYDPLGNEECKEGVTSAEASHELVYGGHITHFGHANIIKYCNRPFDSVSEMDRHLITRWNSVVGANDVVYHLGDFAWGGPEQWREVREKLNGKIHLLRGNHDHALGRCGDLFESVNDMLELKKVVVDVEDDLRKDLVLCHYSLRNWNKKYHGSWHLYGHSHGTLDPYDASFDIGVDCHEFTPVAANDLAVLMWQLTNRNE